MNTTARPRLASIFKPFNRQHRILLLGIFGVQLTLSVPAFAQLSPGTTEYKPGTTPALGPPNYSTTLPGYFTAGNQVDSISPTLIGGGGAFTFSSTVYRDPGTAFLGFDYTLSLAGGSASVTSVVLDNASHPWQGVGITLAGADGTGHSTAGSGSPNWTDGDPIFLFRDTDANGAGITGQFLSSGEGTSIDSSSGDASANIFFATTATSYASTTFDEFSGSTLVASPGGFVPVPEPGEVVLAALAATMLAIRPRLRKA